MSQEIEDLERRIVAAWKAGDAERALSLGKCLDDLCVPVKASPVGAALWYCRRGLHVFPLQPGRKVPYEGSHGLLDASCDRGRVIEMFGERPADSNVGIATGHVVDVIDIDGPEGMISYSNSGMLSEDGRWVSAIPRLGVVSTPRPGGKHIYVPAMGTDSKSHTNSMPHIDTRGLGGYVVAPPSVLVEIPGKQFAGPYVWTRPFRLLEALL